jgi:hypothetical protein
MTVNLSAQQVAEHAVDALMQRAIIFPLRCCSLASLNSLYVLCSMMPGVTDMVSRCHCVNRTLDCLLGEQTLAATYIQVNTALQRNVCCTQLPSDISPLQQRFRTRRLLNPKNHVATKESSSMIARQALMNRFRTSELLQKWRQKIEMHKHVTPLDEHGQKLAMLGCLKLLIYCTKDECCSIAAFDCKKLVWSGGMQVLLAGLASDVHQIREACCIVLIQVARHPTLHLQMLQAGLLSPLLASLQCDSDRIKELSCAVLLQVACNPALRGAILAAGAPVDLMEFIQTDISDANRRRTIRIMQLLAAHQVSAQGKGDASRASGGEQQNSVENMMRSPIFISKLVSFICVEDKALQIDSLKLLQSLTQTSALPIIVDRLLDPGILITVVKRIDETDAEICSSATALFKHIFAADVAQADIFIEAGFQTLVYARCTMDDNNHVSPSQCAASLQFLSAVSLLVKLACASMLSQGLEVDPQVLRVHSTQSRAQIASNICSGILAAVQTPRFVEGFYSVLLKMRAISPLVFFVACTNFPISLEQARADKKSMVRWKTQCRTLQILQKMCAVSAMTSILCTPIILEHIITSLKQLSQDFGVAAEDHTKFYHATVQAVCNTLVFLGEGGRSAAAKITSTILRHNALTAVSLLLESGSRHPKSTTGTRTMVSALALIQMLATNEQSDGSSDDGIVYVFMAQKCEMLQQFLVDPALVASSAKLMGEISASKRRIKVLIDCGVLPFLARFFEASVGSGSIIPAPLFALVSRAATNKKLCLLLSELGLISFTCEYVVRQAYRGNVHDFQTAIDLVLRVINRHGNLCNRLVVKQPVVDAVVHLLPKPEAVKALQEMARDRNALPMLEKHRASSHPVAEHLERLESESTQQHHGDI